MSNDSERSILERLAIIETEILHMREDSNNHMKAIKDLFSVQVIHLTQRVDRLEAHKTWLWQTIFVLAVGGIISLLLSYVK